MKRVFAVATAVAATLVGGAHAAAPAFDSAEGAGSYTASGCPVLIPAGRDLQCFPVSPRHRTFSFSAKEFGFGLRASGFYTQRQDFFGSVSTFSGRVTCLNVLGNTAVFGGIVTGQTNPSGTTDAVGVPFVIWVVDNGTASAGDPPDLISPFAILPDDDPDRPLVPPAFPNVCPQPFPSLYGYFPLDSGNIVVDDESRTVGMP